MLKNMPENSTQNWLLNSSPDIISQEMWPLNSPKLNCLDYHFWGNVWGPSWAPSKTEDSCQIQGNAAGDCLTQGPTNNAVKEF